MCNELKYIDSMGEYCYATYVSDITIIFEYPNKPLYDILVSV